MQRACSSTSSTLKSEVVPPAPPLLANVRIWPLLATRALIVQPLLYGFSAWIGCDARRAPLPPHGPPISNGDTRGRAENGLGTGPLQGV